MCCFFSWTVFLTWQSTISGHSIETLRRGKTLKNSYYNLQLVTSTYSQVSHPERPLTLRFCVFMCIFFFLFELFSVLFSSCFVSFRFIWNSVVFVIQWFDSIKCSKMKIHSRHLIWHSLDIFSLMFYMSFFLLSFPFPFPATTIPIHFLCVCYLKRIRERVQMKYFLVKIPPLNLSTKRKFFFVRWIFAHKNTNPNSQTHIFPINLNTKCECI